MVYCGKPSKGCENCRAKKVRCNGKVPACGQCVKSSKECPGYRNMLDLAFRDESDAVIEKAKAKARRSSLPRVKQNSNALKKITKSCLCGPQISAPESSASLAASSSVSLDTHCFDEPDKFAYDQNIAASTSSLSTFSLSVGRDDLGINFFLSNFVKEANGPSPGQFSYIPELCRTEGLDDTLNASIMAAGLAGYAKRIKSAQLLNQARRVYAVALRRINASLRSPTEAVKNSTLLSTIIVAVFETIVGTKQVSFKGWTEHILGASALVKLRGPQQLTTSVGRGVFHHATSQVLITCFQREIPMPSKLVELRTEYFKNSSSNPAFKYLRMLDQVTILRSLIKSRLITAPEDIIARALKLDGEIMETSSSVPIGWQPETVFTHSDNILVWNGSYDIYWDVWVGQFWNVIRAARIMLNETIRFQLLQGFQSVPLGFSRSQHHAQFQVSTSTCIEMRDGILRSIPQNCGFVSTKPSNSQYNSPEPPGPLPNTNEFFNALFSFTDPLEASSFSTLGLSQALVRDPTFPMIGGYYLLWPLYMAGVTQVSDSSVREFVAKALRYIGEEIGFHIGINLADFLEETMLEVKEEDPKQKATEQILCKRKQKAKEMPEMPELESPMMEIVTQEEEERREMMARKVNGMKIGSWWWWWCDDANMDPQQVSASIPIDIREGVSGK